MKRLLLAILLLFTGTMLRGAGPVKELKILTIGNSFAWSVFDSLRKIAGAEPDCKVTIAAANMSGSSLERHWKYYKEGRKPYNGKYSLAEMLKQNSWDIVTIQQVSQFSWRKESYQPYAGNIIKLIRELAPGAEIVVQQTWSYHANDSRLLPRKKWNIDQNQMYEKLTGCYTALAKEYDLRIIPSGYAVQLYRKAVGEKLKGPDPAVFKTLKQGENPVNPDVVGNFQWSRGRKNKEIFFRQDPIHLNERGKYLQGLVWYGFLFNRDPEKSAYVPEGISPEEAALLKRCAASAVRDFKQVKSRKK